ncbi:Alkaline ceramidase 3 [Lobosporangium transversale]|uniref:Ceramidase n=1 Tax=Lobosporangium transversale TaxID=64571 RepID=A0A1Y2G7C0_9FUNG|nr:ceramidase [Lobosporangium transversale]KAF9917019.1 Alkaline ceramidase 3 [Lobosporangium transversale]ORY99695.1 ceramidase [Lobosporangium transversale]|eukprot:XP_021875959.1 ceramidase [Lobosporangium transversale]
MAPVSATSSSSIFNKIGYWSPNTASVDWCESNYEVSYYIAEFWNTISNLPSLLLVILGYHLFPTNDGRFKLLFWVCGTVAVGSALFHGTLRHKMQLLDELPMLYSATIILYILVETKHGRQGPWFPALLTVWISLTTFIFSTASGKIQFYTFQSTYTILQFCMIYYLRVLHVQQSAKHQSSISTANSNVTSTSSNTYTSRQTKVNYSSYKQPSPSPSLRPQAMADVKILIRRALGFGALAVSIWLVDLRLCEFINGKGAQSLLKWNPQLHAWWHVFSAVAMYHAALLVSFYHYDVLERSPAVYHWKGVVPAIRLGSKLKPRER